MLGFAKGSIPSTRRCCAALVPPQQASTPDAAFATSPNSRLERLIRNKHDALSYPHETGRGENPMYQPALPVQHPHIALGEKLRAHEPSKARMFIRAFIGHVLRLLRFLGQFAATGGPLS
jgi:hypothetical protein